MSWYQKSFGGSTAARRANQRAVRSAYARALGGSLGPPRKLNQRQKKEVKQIIGKRVESKFFDAGFGASNYTSTPAHTCLSLIPQGGSDSQRVGDQVKLKKLTLRMQFVGGDIYNTCRVVVYRYKQDTSVQGPITAEVYDSSAPGAEYVLCPVPALEKNDKFHIIWDKIVTLPQTNYYTTSSQVTSTSNSVKTWVKSFYGRRLGAKGLRFNPAATTGFGHIYVSIVSDSAILPNPTVYLNSRLEYTDS